MSASHLHHGGHALSGLTPYAHLSLRKATSETIEPGSKIRTNGWTGYTELEKHGYGHHVVEHQSIAPGEDPTALVHRIASLLKRWHMGTHHGRVEQEHLQEYLDEYIFRFNSRHSRSRGKLFYRLVQGLLGVKQG